MKKTLTVILTLLLALLLTESQALAKKERPLSQKEEIEKQIRQYMDECKTVGMCIVLVKGDKVVYQGAFGYHDLDTKAPLKLNEIFRIASISKSFSAASILQLQEQGKIDLDDDVNEYLPFSLRNPRFPEIPITVKQLLSHTSSMRDFKGASWYRDDQYVNPGKTSMDTISKVFFEYAPGWGFMYCNRGLNLMGMIIEKASGERFDNYVRQHILLPMGIEKAGFNLDSLGDPQQFVQLYKYDGINNEYVPGAGYVRSNEKRIAAGSYRPVLDACYWSPTGGMKISAPDLAQWMMTLRDNGVAPNGTRILSEKSAQKMKTPVTPPDPSRAWQYYCLNLVYQPYLIEGRTLIGHTGSAQGLKSCMFFDKDSDWGVVCICSSEDGRHGINAQGKDTGIVKVYYDAINYLFNRFKETLLAE